MPFDREKGLSPRGRGEPSASSATPYPGSVYPRVGGGTYLRYWLLHMEPGLSPRGRGNLGHCAVLQVHQGSIPAWAGEPSRCCRSSTPGWVYPRVGGGTGLRPFAKVVHQGLSPRGRGNRLFPQVAGIDPGSIPAWAGEPWLSPPRLFAKRVYPRVGGGTRCRRRCCRGTTGLSPRGRGNRPPETEE